ncbi:glucose sorbosone dehydrogenase [Spongiactinospora gelatinilytica]|uniref:Glucose sorbosone dehydrogenase n=1 Tax=Spongiactinospora gelatinilytica TaxID=2666298 RepID=A0A2W2HTV9_9ACTN|nr:PQQ-dependent sugar dehydrogenase [Spongiactinospora gelatinilytica]PZG54120.1 glucose sorbosone dehydrogenase [Spongiactinospora gelatinilytica]
MRIGIPAAVAVTAAVLLGACSAAPETGVGAGRTPSPAPTESPVTSPPASPPSGDMRVAEARTLVKGLAAPWAIAFLPNGDALVTERDSARLLRVTPQGKVTPLGTIEGVSPAGEGGLMGVAVSPDHADDNYIFLYFTADDDNRIVRYRLTGNGLSDARVILSGIPKGAIHNGGRLAFGPDRRLYATTGEVGDRPLAQDRGSLAGKILRMTVDGKPAPGNPFDGSLVWSYGHRNVQGLAWDPAGRLFATEFGADTFDEVNLIREGQNYGWPEVEGVGGGGRFVDPLLTWSTGEASPSGLAYAGGSLWAGALRGARLWQVPVSGEGAVGTPVAHFREEYGRLRAVAAAPDGSLWVATSNKDGRGSPAADDDRVLVVPAG